MSVLRDYIAYAKEHIHPTISEQAQQRLIQAYVDMRKIGAGRGQISAYPRQLESLIRLSEAHAKVRLSHTVDMQDVEEAWRLHREALKQSATDPLSGKIDVGILTTGLSSAARKKKADLVVSIKENLKKKGKVPTVSYQKLFLEIKETSQIVSTYSYTFDFFLYSLFCSFLHILIYIHNCKVKHLSPIKYSGIFFFVLSQITSHSL